MLSKKLIHSYQLVYEKKYGKKIAAKKAEQELLDLAKLVKLIKTERRNHYGR